MTTPLIRSINNSLLYLYIILTHYICACVKFPGVFSDEIVKIYMYYYTQLGEYHGANNV